MPFPRGRALHRGDLALLLNFRAAAACALAQRHGEVRRSDVAVIGMVESADDLRRGGPVAQLNQGPQLAHLRWAYHLKGHADGIRGTAVLLILIHAIAAGRQAQISGDVKAHVLTGLGGQPLVEVDGVFVQLADRVAHVEQGQQARRMPGRSRGQLRALQQHRVAPTFQGQMVERADADHTATDHYDAGMSFHLMSPNENASGSVTTGPPNKTPIATIPYGNAPGPPETAPWEGFDEPEAPSEKRQEYVGNGQEDAPMAYYPSPDPSAFRLSEASWNRPRYCVNASMHF